MRTMLVCPIVEIGYKVALSQRSGVACFLPIHATVIESTEFMISTTMNGADSERELNAECGGFEGSI